MTTCAAQREEATAFYASTAAQSAAKKAAREAARADTRAAAADKPATWAKAQHAPKGNKGNGKWGSMGGMGGKAGKGGAAAAAAGDGSVKRQADRSILANRGLTPHRRKEVRNARVKHRRAYESAVKRRRGQVRDVRALDRPYEGEAAGINPRVVRATRLGPKQ